MKKKNNLCSGAGTQDQVVLATFFERRPHGRRRWRRAAARRRLCRIWIARVAERHQIS